MVPSEQPIAGHAELEERSRSSSKGGCSSPPATVRAGVSLGNVEIRTLPTTRRSSDTTDAPRAPIRSFERAILHAVDAALSGASARAANLQTANERKDRMDPAIGRTS
jgi:hypothetical protein